MAILHGSWLESAQSSAIEQSRPRSIHGFFIWGETWRRLDLAPAAPSNHPFALNAEELIAFVRSLQQTQQLTWPIAAMLEAPKRSRSAPGTGSRAGGTGSRKTALTIESAIDGDRWRTPTYWQPTYELQPIGWLPQLSASAALEPPSQKISLQPWQIEGICLEPLEAIALLNTLPLSSVSGGESLGSDLRYWSHVARWHLDLLARSKFLPSLKSTSDQVTTAWQALIDSADDQARLEHFARQMPPACRTYVATASVATASVVTASVATASVEANVEANVEAKEPTFATPQTLLLDFLNALTEVQVRSIAASSPIPANINPKEIALREWLQSLGSEAAVTADEVRLDRLTSSWATWTAPIQQQLNQQTASFRTCFYLQPPLFDREAWERTGQDWTLEFFLQSSHDPDFLVSARTIWQNPVDRFAYLGRSIEHPQETLLAGLGLASRLYPVIEPSLQVSQPHSCQLNSSLVYDFIKTTAWRLKDSGFGVVLPPGLSPEQGWASRLGLSVRAEPPSGRQRLGLQSLLNFRWELSIGGQRLSKSEFDRLVDLNTPLVEVNGEWVELRSQDVRAAQAFFTSRKDQLSLSLEDALRMSTGDTQTIEKLPVVHFEASGSLQELVQTLTTGNQSVEAIAVPKTFRGELRPYQVRGASWLAFLERWGLGACLADDMGLGKTVQLITLLLHLQEENALEQPILLVCPTSVLGNWEREVKRFAPSLKVLVHHGDKRSQGKAFAKAAQKHDLVVTSYALTYRDSKDFEGVSWQGVVLDEAQNIKNADSKQSQAVRQLQPQFRIALTGTPVENRLSELWSILDFLNPGYLGPRNFFQRRFAIPIERYGDTASLQTLRSLVQPFILRRLKTDRTIIQDLPEKQEMSVFCGLSTEQATLYQAAVDHSLREIDSAAGIQRHGMILALLVKLKQICNHPVLSQGKAATMNGDFGRQSGKLQRLSEMLEELLAEGDTAPQARDRALIFTQFAEWGKLLKSFLEQQFGREVLFLYGGSSKKQREEMVDRFQSDPQAPRIFILSLKAGGVGLNLTRANHVFHFDRWWNPAVENQATDRVFRIGQTRNVQVHKFVCTGTLEERIHELIESKKALSEQIVGTGESWLTDFDTEQLRDLLLLDRTAVIDD